LTHRCGQHSHGELPQFIIANFTDSIVTNNKETSMQKISLRKLGVFLFMAMFLGACALQFPSPQAPGEPQVVALPPVPKIDPMADVPGDRPLPPLVGAMERIDCISGVEDLHARMALKARGGRIASFAYYSKWKPRTCALDFATTSPGTKWRVTADGHTRVHTPQGRFLIRTQSDSYVFEFEQVQRGKFCGMPGEINGTMTIRRGTGAPSCSVAGIMDTNDRYLDVLYKK
jgi:hypothetical protein